MPYYVYILLCKDGSYYTGHAKDVKRRVALHKKGQGARYTKIHKPEKTVYVEKFDSRSEAMKREQEIKSLSHSEKKRLINLYITNRVSMKAQRFQLRIQGLEKLRHEKGTSNYSKITKIDNPTRVVHIYYQTRAIWKSVDLFDLFLLFGICMFV